MREISFSPSFFLNFKSTSRRRLLHSLFPPALILIALYYTDLTQRLYMLNSPHVGCFDVSPYVLYTPRAGITVYSRPGYCLQQARILSTAGRDTVYSRPGCCLQQAGMLSTAGRDAVYSRPGCCLQQAGMLSTAGRDAVYSRPGCCLQQAGMLSTAGRDAVYSRPGCCLQQAGMLSTAGRDTV